MSSRNELRLLPVWDPTADRLNRPPRSEFALRSTRARNQSYVKGVT